MGCIPQKGPPRMAFDPKTDFEETMMELRAFDRATPIVAKWTCSYCGARNAGTRCSNCGAEECR
jgi:hypothetical protein